MPRGQKRKTATADSGVGKRTRKDSASAPSVASKSTRTSKRIQVDSEETALPHSPRSASMYSPAVPLQVPETSGLLPPLALGVTQPINDPGPPSPLSSVDSLPSQEDLISTVLPAEPLQIEIDVNDPTSLQSSESLTNDETASGTELDDYMREMQAEKTSDIKLPILKAIKESARWLPRGLSPFADVQQILDVGISFNGIPSTNWDLQGAYTDMTISEIQHKLTMYRNILNMMPHLGTHLKRWQSKPDVIVVLADFIEKHARNARSDDVHKIKTHCLHHVPHIENDDLGIPPIDPNTRMNERGFNHLATARLLVPRESRDDFDSDPSAYCMSYRARHITFSEQNLPLFLYPEDSFDPDKPTENLMCCKMLYSLAKVLYFGPASVSATVPVGGSSKGHGGRPPVNRRYKLERMSAPMIAYLCLLIRHGLSSNDRWNNGNNDSFSGPAFYNNLMEILEHPIVGVRILNAWNENLFGRSMVTATEMRSSEERAAPSLMDRIRENLESSA